MLDEPKTQGGVDSPQSAHDRKMLDHRRATICLLAMVATGCQVGIFAKRESECSCPTDIRKTVPWCAGEDAVFICPCGPSGDFYGHKPTCWRTWPAPATVWRDAYCGSATVEGCNPIYPIEIGPPVFLGDPAQAPIPNAEAVLPETSDTGPPQGPRALPPPSTSTELKPLPSVTASVRVHPSRQPTASPAVNPYLANKSTARRESGDALKTGTTVHRSASKGNSKSSLRAEPSRVATTKRDVPKHQTPGNPRQQKAPNEVQIVTKEDNRTRKQQVVAALNIDADGVVQRSFYRGNSSDTAVLRQAIFPMVR
jgi:hypothetical protein